MVCKEAACLEHDMAKATESRCGGLVHFLKNKDTEAILGQQNVFSMEILETLAEKFYRQIYFCGQNDQQSKKNCHKFST